MAMMSDLNRAGLTSSGGACRYADTYRQWAREGRLNMRFFCFGTAGGARTPEEVDKLLPEIPKLKLFTGDDWIDHVNWGERLYSVTDNTTDLEPMATPEDFAQWGRVAREVAKAGIPILIHSTMEWTIEGQLAQVELVNQEFPVRHLRWAFAHLEQITPSQIERMKKLGMYLAVHPRAIISGAHYNRLHGDRSYEMPPLKTIQDSGIQWGLGTDAFEVNQYRPFTTLWWAVTGKMVGGRVVNRQPIGREDALIAHTRKNAYFPRKRSGFDPAGQAGGPGGDRPRLPHRASGPDQRHSTGADDGGREDRLRCRGGDVNAIARLRRSSQRQRDSATHCSVSQRYGVDGTAPAS